MCRSLNLVQNASQPIKLLYSLHVGAALIVEVSAENSSQIIRNFYESSKTVSLTEK